MTPLRISFTLDRPMRVPEFPIHLDALLAWSAVKEAEDMGHDTPFDAQEHLPLAREGQGDDAVWCASQLLYRPLSTPEHVTLVKRYELDAIARRQGSLIAGGPNKIPMGTGPYKAFVLGEPVVWVAGVVAYALGEAERIGELLTRITHIGKRRGIGMGRVSATDIQADARAEHAWRYRIMPTPCEGYEPIEAAIRPPYWQRESRRIAYIPTHIDGELYASAS